MRGHTAFAGVRQGSAKAASAAFPASHRTPKAREARNVFSGLFSRDLALLTELLPDAVFHTGNNEEPKKGPGLVIRPMRVEFSCDAGPLFADDAIEALRVHIRRDVEGAAEGDIGRDGSPGIERRTDVLRCDKDELAPGAARVAQGGVGAVYRDEVHRGHGTWRGRGNAGRVHQGHRGRIGRGGERSGGDAVGALNNAEVGAQPGCPDDLPLARVLPERIRQARRVAVPMNLMTSTAVRST